MTLSSPTAKISVLGHMFDSSLVRHPSCSTIFTICRSNVLSNNCTVEQVRNPYFFEATDHMLVLSSCLQLMNLKGDIAVAIMITVVTNIVGIFTIPLYLEWLIYSDVNVQFNVGKMMLKLFLTLFIPLAVRNVVLFCLY